MSRKRPIDVFQAFRTAMKKLKYKYEDLDFSIADERTGSIQFSFTTPVFLSVTIDIFAWELDIDKEQITFCVFPRNDAVRVYFNVKDVLEIEEMSENGI